MRAGRCLLLLALAGSVLAGCAGSPAHPGIGSAVRGGFDRTGAGPLQGWDAAGNWTVVAEADARSPPNVAHAAPTGKLLPSFALVPEQAYDEVDASVAVRTDGQAGLVFRSNAATGRYAAAVLDAANGSVALLRGQDVQVERVAAAAANATGWHVLAVQVRGGHAAVRVDGAPLLAADVEMPSQGSLGLFALPDSEARFDDLAADPAR
jgi:hypothetical protein